MTLDVRTNITQAVSRAATNKSCTVFMSSGIDSHSILFSCIEAGISPTITSFTLDDRESRDFRAAKHAAEIFNLPFRPVVLSTSIHTLKRRILSMAKMGVKGKTSFECLWPMLTAFSMVKEDLVLTGYGADAYFALSKRGTMHYKNNVSAYALESFEKYKQPDSQYNFLKRFAHRRGLSYYCPWLCRAMTSQVQNHIFTFDDLNKPKQKNPVREQYASYLRNCMVYNHVNYQLGDSGISELFRRLLDDPIWNAKQYKSTTGLFNSVVRQEITEP